MGILTAPPRGACAPSRGSRFITGRSGRYRSSVRSRLPPPDETTRAMPDQPLPPPIEQAALANLRTIGGGDASFVAEIVQMFREDTPPHLDELDASAAAGDAIRLAKVAHGLKGSAGNFGAKHFRTLTERIEAIAKSGRLSEAPAAIGELRAEYARVLTALDAAIAEG